MRKIAGILAVAALLCVTKNTILNENRYTDSVSVCADAKIIDEQKEVFTMENQGENALQVRAKSAYLMDYSTQTPMYAQRENERLPIASMCKIMTLLLCFDAIDAGDLQMEETLRVSEKAASMGGSQVFLEANGEYKVRELLKSIVVCSANDSCVAMAERLAGSERMFTEKMNEKAKSIGAENTLFANCTGLPQEPQYSCAKDVAIMLKHLLAHKEYFEFGNVWMDKFSHPKGRITEITNTNKLIRFYDGCDGGKTGFTNDAGFCLAATAKRKDMRVISVVIGETTSANRFEDVREMFDYAFAEYTTTAIVQKDVVLETRLKVNGGKIKEIEVFPKESIFAFYKRGQKGGYTIEYTFQKIKAPISIGDEIGELTVYKDGVEYAKVPLLSKTEVKKANFFDRMKDIARLWNK